MQWQYTLISKVFWYILSNSYSTTFPGIITNIFGFLYIKFDLDLWSISLALKKTCLFQRIRKLFTSKKLVDIRNGDISRSITIQNSCRLYQGTSTIFWSSQMNVYHTRHVVSRRWNRNWLLVTQKLYRIINRKNVEFKRAAALSTTPTQKVSSYVLLDLNLNFVECIMRSCIQDAK